MKMETLFNLFPLILLAVGYGAGRHYEKLHLQDLRRREAATVGILVSPVGTLPGVELAEPRLVVGAAVISIDYFKRFAAALRGLFGGRMMALETVVDRGRREAVMRMKEQAVAAGLNGVVGMRVETSRLANSRSNGKGTAGIEIVAYGTAVRVPQSGSATGVSPPIVSD